jgi:2-oxoglutarate ferredoxin oxidoreductase subunit beta
MGNAVAMMTWQKEHGVRIEQAATMSKEELEDKFTVGVLVDRELPIYTDEYNLVRAAAKEKADAGLAKRGGPDAVDE